MTQIGRKRGRSRLLSVALLASALLSAVSGSPRAETYPPQPIKLVIPYPTVVVFAAIGVYTVSNSVAEVFLFAFFGLLGYVFSKLDCEPAPLLLAFVVGPLLEENFRRAMQLSRGSLAVFFERPISATLLTLAGILLAIALLPLVRRRRQDIFDRSDS